MIESRMKWAGKVACPQKKIIIGDHPRGDSKVIYKGILGNILCDFVNWIEDISRKDLLMIRKSSSFLGRYFSPLRIRHFIAYKS
jgi:hypothetical protein